MKIAGIEFDGPHDIDTTSIPANRAAVYAITCRSTDGKYHVIDVGESGETGVRLANHERRPCWKHNCNGSLSAYLHYMPSSQGYDAASRRQLEAKIRQQYSPPCGKI